MTRPVRAPAPSVSGRFLLRLPPGLHAALRHAARDQGASLNDYCARKLAAPLGDVTRDGGAEVVAGAAEVAGDHLVGVVAFGSWARGEASDRSDVDVLVVVDEALRLSRRLYAEWDERPVTIDGRAVDPHFVHLPPLLGPVAGIWAEVAIDGLVLFERHLAISKRLTGVRRLVADGRLARRVVHGQPYWIEEAPRAQS